MSLHWAVNHIGAILNPSAHLFLEPPSADAALGQALMNSTVLFIWHDTWTAQLCTWKTLSKEVQQRNKDLDHPTCFCVKKIVMYLKGTTWSSVASLIVTNTIGLISPASIESDCNLFL